MIAGNVADDSTLDRMFQRPALLATLVALMSGCIPLPIPNDRAVSPQFHGQVTDDSGSPVPSASLRVVAHLMGRPAQGDNQFFATAQTDERGFYRVGVTERDSWYVLFVGPAEGFCSGTLTVTHPSYEERSFKVEQFRGAAVNGMCNGFEVRRDVVLKRK
jgi:hypothetical protein